MNATRSTRIGAALAAALLTLTLAACASDTPDGLTLAQSKSPVQLLRNEVASRVPSALVADVTNSSDASSACRTEETDPEGLLRSWKSSVRITLTPEADLEIMLSKLLVSFREDGWDEGTYGSATIIEFTRDDSIAEIHISTKRATDTEAAQIQVQVAGPCVMTGGAESDEVLALEKAAAAELQ